MRFKCLSLALSVSLLGLKCILKDALFFQWTMHWLINEHKVTTGFCVWFRRAWSRTVRWWRWPLSPSCWSWPPDQTCFCRSSAPISSNLVRLHTNPSSFMPMLTCCYWFLSSSINKYHFFNVGQLSLCANILLVLRIW